MKCKEKLIQGDELWTTGLPLLSLSPLTGLYIHKLPNENRDEHFSDGTEFILSLKKKKKKSLNLTSGFHRESQNKWPALPPLWSHHKPEVTLSGRFKKVQPPHPPTNSGCRECRCASACSSPECWKVILEGISEQGSSHFVHTLFLSLQRQVPLPPPPPKCWILVCSFSFKRNYHQPLYLFIIVAIKKESAKSLEFVNKVNSWFDILLCQRTNC